MDATTVSGVLLELNVINTPDIDAQINKMAAQLNDERAAKWFRRVPRYFVINIDQQRDTPLKVKPEERGHHASNFYVDPKNPASDSELPTAGHEQEKGWESVYDLATRFAKTKIRKKASDPEPENWPEEHRNLMRERGEAVEWISNQMGQRPTSSPGWGNLSTDPIANRFFNDLIAKAAKQLAAEGHDVEPAWTSTSSDERRDTESEEALGTQTRASRRVKQKRLNRAVKQTESVDDLVDRLLEADYETMLHQPLVHRDIEQNFSPFKAAKAKAKRIHGEPPTKDELPDWMKAKDSGKKELYHFDPIQVQRRSMWNDLKGLVTYLNWQHDNLKLAGSEDKEEAAKGRSAEMLFRRLHTMKTEDIDGFRDVLGQAKEFQHQAAKEPWRFTKEGKVLAKSGPYTLMRVTNPELVMALTKRPTGDTTYPEPSWCVGARSWAESYGKHGPFYFVDKNGDPYALVHFQSGQARGINNRDISSSDAYEIGQLFKNVNVNTELAGGYSTSPGYANLVSSIVDVKGR